MADRIVRGEEHAGKVVVRHASRWFSAGTEIVTGPNETAVLVRDGRAIATIPPGKTRVLDLEKAPFLKSLADASGTSFGADIFFVTTAPLAGIRFGTKKTIMDAKAHHAVAVAFMGEASVRVSEAGTFAKLVAANDSLERDPMPSIAKTLSDVVGDAVERTLAEKIASVLDIGRGPELIAAITARMKTEVVERRAGIELLSLHALDAMVDERGAAVLKSKAGGPGRGCPGCGIPIGAGWAKYCPECGATLPG